MKEKIPKKKRVDRDPGESTCEYGVRLSAIDSFIDSFIHFFSSPSLSLPVPIHPLAIHFLSAARFIHAPKSTGQGLRTQQFRSAEIKCFQ